VPTLLFIHRKRASETGGKRGCGGEGRAGPTAFLISGIKELTWKVVKQRGKRRPALFFIPLDVAGKRRREGKSCSSFVALQQRTF